MTVRRRYGTAAFLDDRRGAVAVMFALVIIPVMLATGMAVDYAMAMRNQRNLQNAADASALAASKAAFEYLAGHPFSSTEVAAAITLGKSAAQTAFAANTAELSALGTTGLTVAMNIPSTRNISTTVTASLAFKTAFLTLVGIDTISLTADAAATTLLPVVNYQFIFLVDISGSMAIGGTSADIASLQASAQFGKCGFACHDPNHYAGTTDYRALAKTKGIKLKIDYVNDAVQTFLGALGPALTKNGANSITSIYTFGTTLTPLLVGATSMSAAMTSAATIDVEPVGPASSNWGYTNTTAALTSLKSLLKNVGDGTNSTARKTYVVFITDGLEDTTPSCSIWGRCTGISYGTACTNIKNAGATLIAIDAAYPVVPNDDQYVHIVAPYTSQFAPVLKGCASASQWYFSASDGPAIQAAMAAIVSQITKSLRLSN